ncbi:MHS family proline/betaine transporter-like MFS transporter [Amycolatopsis sulphurea]|uniref:MHS family proline/betaine transporter-like MFS transporter n=1 Tax=Amycolatopsis sulphurea TaxID=76022 RepID=A0A2A9FKE9_9PSEU|nr:MFS transporter [Amycolatopsis sulphurea]PFG51032.1 MHS family proline/betaine transporter-like MFS transporter [Amycolatopsis sulphurea]
MNSASSPVVAHPPVRAKKTSIFGGLVGVFIELYDNAVYGFVAGTLAVVFFPGDEPATGVLLTFVAFAIPFFFRPLGAAVAGSWGDRFGRKRVLLGLITLMTLSTGLVGALPGYRAAGVFAPIALVVLRVLQGFAMGGEPGNGNSFLAEHAGEGRRGRVVSYANAATFIAMLLGTLFAALLNATLTKAAMESWGWRLPFLLALPMGLIGLAIRRAADESREFTAAEVEGEVTRSPLREAFGSRETVRGMLMAVVLPLFNSSGYFILFIYMPSFMKNDMHFSTVQGLMVTGIMLAVGTFGVLYAGRLSDRVGRKKMLATSAFLMVALGFPCYWLLTQGSFLLATLGAVVMALCFSGTNGVMQVTLAELFPTRVRTVAYGVGYNVGTAIFGGAAPLVVSALIVATGSTWVPAFYLVLTSIVAGIAALRIRETAFAPLKR